MMEPDTALIGVTQMANEILIVHLFMLLGGKEHLHFSH